MRKLFPLVFAIFSVTAMNAQTAYEVNGKIIDASTKLPMVSASVFAENTTIGTATDAEGKFKLQLPNGGYNLAVTFTGYETEFKRITTADADNRNILIEIRQKQREMEDVVIKATYEVSDGWEKYGNFFLENFIGNTENSKQCIIKNTAALKFYFYKRKNRLKIISTEPLLIENNALGYLLTYSLDSFSHEYNTSTTLYSGAPLFEEMIPATEAQKTTWQANRLKAYQGSILHFMRSLYQKKLQEEGFEIQFLVKDKDKDMAIPLKDFYGGLHYEKDDSTQTVEIWPNQSEVLIIFKHEKPDQYYQTANAGEPGNFQLSLLSFISKQSVVIEQNGYYFEQTSFSINQYLSWEKMADMLPYDYSRKQ